MVELNVKIQLSRTRLREIRNVMWNMGQDRLVWVRAGVKNGWDIKSGGQDRGCRVMGYAGEGERAGNPKCCEDTRCIPIG